MNTIDKINKISNELFKANFIFLSELEQNMVLKHYLAENTIPTV